MKTDAFLALLCGDGGALGCLQNECLGGAGERTVAVLLGQAETPESSSPGPSGHYCRDAKCFRAVPREMRMKVGERHAGSWQVFGIWGKRGSGKSH